MVASTMNKCFNVHIHSAIDKSQTVKVHKTINLTMKQL